MILGDSMQQKVDLGKLSVRVEIGKKELIASNKSIPLLE